MLTELKLANFRIFDDEVTVRFRPITVLIGRNSSGKSSIIKFLLMLQQSLGPGRSQFLTVEGDKVNLGVFSALKNSLTRKRNLTFELSTKSATAQLGYPISAYLELSEDMDHSKLLYKASASISYSKRTSIGRATYSLADEASGKELVRVANRILDDSTFWDYSPRLDGLEYSSEPHDSEESPQQILERIERSQELLLRSMVETEIISVPRYDIGSIRHLSPVRDESQRVIVASSPPYDNVGQRGQYALPHLH